MTVVVVVALGAVVVFAVALGAELVAFGAAVLVDVDPQFQKLLDFDLGLDVVVFAAAVVVVVAGFALVVVFLVVAVALGFLVVVVVLGFAAAVVVEEALGLAGGTMAACVGFAAGAIKTTSLFSF